MGFTAEADRDIGVLTQLLAPDEKHGLAVFVDDLDRCGSTHIVEIVEAMNQIFNAARDHRCVFVLGLDRDVVTANVEAAYKNVIDQLDHNNTVLAQHFGQEFLAKLVQLSVSLPQPPPEALQVLMERITRNTRVQGPTSPAAGVQAGLDNGDAKDNDARTPQENRPTPSDTATLGDARPEAIRDSPEIAEAEFLALDYLDRNPRQVKRFHNAFRLQLYVANEDDKTQFDFTADELIALAKWVVVRLRWPDLGDAIERNHKLLRIIEAEANNEPTPTLASSPDGQQLIQETGHWLRNPAVHKLMNDIPSRRLSTLELKTFLRVA